MKKKPLRVAVDMDNVSADMANHVLKRINEKYGTHYTMDDIVEWDQKFRNGDKEIDYSKEIYRNFNEPGFIESAPLIPGAKDGIKRLLDRGNDVHFLTGRSEKYVPASKEWAKQIDPDLRVVSSGNQGKHMFIPNFDVLIDDAPKELMNVSIHGGNAVAFDRPWNRGVKQLTARRVADWKEFTDSLEQ